MDVSIPRPLTDSQPLRESIQTYSQSTGIQVMVIDTAGVVISQTTDGFAVCDTFESLDNHQGRCREHHLNASRQAFGLGDTYISICPWGLVHFTAPVVQGGSLQGALVAGPVLFSSLDDFLVTDLIRKNNLPEDLRNGIRDQLTRIPVVDPVRARYLSRLLFQTALCLITDGSERQLYERKERFSQQNEINEFIQEAKQNVAQAYPYHKEKELLSKVKNGDVIGARTILNEILGYMFFTEGVNIDILKLRVLELCTLLSRAAIEGGASLTNVLGINYRFINSMDSINSMEDLTYWSLKILARFTENVLKNPDSKNRKRIQMAINYINEHYMESLTLQQTADYIHLNPSYFSNLFKQEAGVNFSTYLNSVRIENSKQLLADLDRSILDVAIAVGFEDQSYFSKVFKKYTGQTPKAFRNGL